MDDNFRWWVGWHETLHKIAEKAGPEVACNVFLALGDRAFYGTEPDFSDDLVADVFYSSLRREAASSVDKARAASEAGRRGGRPTKKGAKRARKGTLSKPNDSDSVKKGAKRDPFCNETAARTPNPETAIPAESQESKTPPFNYRNGKEPMWSSVPELQCASLAAPVAGRDARELSPQPPEPVEAPRPPDWDRPIDVGPTPGAVAAPMGPTPQVPE